MQRDEIEPFQGLMTTPHACQIPKLNSRTCQNFDVTPQGSLTPLPGYTLDSTPFSTYVMFMLNYVLSNGTKYLIASDGIDFKYSTGDTNWTYIGYKDGTATRSGTALTGSSTLWATNVVAGDQFKYDADSTWININTVTDNTNIVLASSAGATSGAYTIRKVMNKTTIPCGCVLEDVAVISDGVRIASSWNGSSFNRITNMPYVRYLTVHKRHVFGAIGSQIYWSDINVPTTWQTINTEKIASKDGGQIIGIKSYANSLVILKDNGKMYQMVGEAPFDASDATYQIIAVDTPDGMGIISPRTYTIHKGLLVFQTSTGIYSFDGVSVERISEEIKPSADRIYTAVGFGSTPATTVDNSSSLFAAGTYSNTEYDTTNGIKLKQDKIFDNFTDGDYTSSPTWTVIAGTWTITGGLLQATVPFGFPTPSISTPSTVAYGTWSWTSTVIDKAPNNPGARTDFILSSLSGGNGYSIWLFSSGNQFTSLTMYKITGGAFASVYTTSITPVASPVIKVTRSSIGTFEVFIDGVSKFTYTDNTYTTSSFLRLAGMPYTGASDTGYVTWDDILISALIGTYTSRVIDGTTLISSWTSVVVASVLNGESYTLEYRAEAGASPSGAWTTIVSGQTIAPTARYFQYRLTLNSTVLLGITPYVSSVTVNYATTQPSATTPFIWSDNNRMYITYSVGGAVNSEQLILDEKGQWLNSTYPIFTVERFNNQLYASDSGSGKIWKLLQGYSANGTALTRIWESKQFEFDVPEVTKKLVRLYITCDPSNASVDIGISIDNGAYVYETVSLASTGSADNGVRQCTANVAGNTIQFRLRITSADTTFVINKMVMYYDVMELR